MAAAKFTFANMGFIKANEAKTCQLSDVLANDECFVQVTKIRGGCRSKD